MAAPLMASPAMMNELRWKKRRVFVVTELSKEEIRNKFRDSGVLDAFEQEFAFTTDADEAEFIIFDFDHPPAWWGRHVGRERWLERWPPLDPATPVPYFFASFGPAADPARIPDDVKMRRAGMQETMDSIGIQLRTADPKKIVEDLRWFRCMLPFHKKGSGPGGPGEDTVQMALYAVKK